MQLRIKELRKELNLSQQEVATGAGISRSVLSEYESGNVDPSATALSKLADFFQISADYLLGRSDDLGIVTTQSGAHALSAEEKELVRLYRSLSPQFRKMAIDMLQLWLQQAKAESGSKKHA